MRIALFPAVGLVGSALLFLKVAGFFLDDQPVFSAVTPALAQTGDAAGTDTEAPPDAADAVSDMPVQDAGESAPMTEEHSGGDADAEDAEADPDATDTAADDVSDGGEAGDSNASNSAAPQELELGTSPAERKLLQQLRERRREVDRRSKAAETREKLLEAAEQRIDSKIDALKEIQTAIKEEEEEREAEAAEKIKLLVTMYEAMKAKDAARIFDRLGLDVLTSLAASMKPKKMADILAKMNDESAERLTIALSGLADGPALPSAGAAALPKIQGNLPQ